MVELGLHKTFCLVYRLIDLALALPVSTATVERAFFAMNIIKTNLHDKMRDEFPIDSLVCYVEKDVFKNIDNEFSSKTLSPPLKLFYLRHLLEVMAQAPTTSYGNCIPSC
ncbi:hypothetical protein V2J09_017151 [Rumex salicifolius]